MDKIIYGIQNQGAKYDGNGIEREWSSVCGVCGGWGGVVCGGGVLFPRTTTAVTTRQWRHLRTS